MNDKSDLLMVLIIAAIFGMLAFGLNKQSDSMQHQIADTRQEIERLEQENVRLRKQLDELRQERQVMERLEQWLETWDVDTWEATAYAPLDPRAVEGMCYSGDPAITASGAEVVPYLTAAAGPDIEFGTPVYVVGDGPRIVQDRGSRIGSGNIDLAVETREEALKFGRQPVKVVYRR